MASKLSDKPSEALIQALEDLIKCERSPKYEIDMDYWNESSGGVCSVCLGGSALVKTYKVPPGDGGEPWDVLCSLEALKVKAMDRAREGDWTAFLDYWPECNRREFPIEKLPRITPYEESPNKFKRGIRKAARIFKEHGL